MKKIMAGIFGLAVIAHTNTANGTTYSNKTFLSTRPTLNNLALSHTTWNKSLAKTIATKHGGTLQVSGLYQHTTDKKNLGQYFGCWAPNAQEYRDYFEVSNAVFANAGDAAWAPNIVYNYAGGGGNPAQNHFSDKIQLRPYQEIMSARFDYYQNLDKIAQGFFFEFSLPVVSIKNVIDPQSIATAATPINLANHDARGKTLLDYLKGTVAHQSDAHAEYIQNTLNASKIVNSRCRTGISDLSTKLGFNIFNTKTRRLGISALATIPTSNRPTGEYLFEESCGNGHHWGLGGGIDTLLQLWHNSKASISCAANITTQYLFKDTEKRTLGIKKADGTALAFGQYYAVAQKRLAKVVPFANISTQDLHVTPGVLGEGLFTMTAALKSLNFTIGYNLFVKQKEDVQLTHAWENNTYALPNPREYHTDAIFPQADNNYNDNNPLRTYINDTNIDFNAVTTPTQISHKLIGALSYVPEIGAFTFDVGGSYEYGHNNAAPSAYAIWLKTSYLF